MSSYSLGIDVGTTAVKAILLSENRIVYQTSAAHDLLSPHPGWAEEDAGQWWRNAIRVVRETLAAVPDAREGIRAIGVSGMVPAIVLLDEKGEPLRNSIQQNDARATGQIERLKRELDQEKLFAATGGFTNQQHALPRLLWVRECEPEIWPRIESVLGSYDYLNYKLTGVRALEINWAVESGLYDIRKREWIAEQLDLLGLPSDVFPQVKESAERIGVVSEEAAALTGLAAGTPVIAGSADHIASTLAAGIIDQDELLIKFGGAGDILYCMNEIRPAPELFFDYHVYPGKYLLNGCMASSGSLVKWYSNELLQDESPDLFARLDREAEQVPPGSDGLVVLPYFLGEKTPIFDPEARGVLFGLSLAHKREHIFRAILESVIYGFRHHLEVIHGLGYEPKRILATNGGAKSKFWCQIAADVLNAEIRSYPSHPGSALGVAFLAGKSEGVYERWEQIRDFLTDYRDYKPSPHRAAIYDKAYAIYRELYMRLKPLFASIGKLYDGAAESREEQPK
ncbi:FGGY-family carbohydrate kinase [Cohnella xylanilytica]|uniref:FGGY-family carbohydrate kinase n=1 Tax=Cohnella xylanilytica TaxID=557555 RepID=A0A841U6X4_9BACL|nr:FGGY-family carbohydrate kinase [Cohnella xylanilytica]MBB6695402.1 FGGY-family carbohydrate kinase [Cohnella xylanilytica]